MLGIPTRRFRAVAVFGTNTPVAAVDDQVHVSTARRACASYDRRALRPVTRERTTPAGDHPRRPNASIDVDRVGSPGRPGAHDVLRIGSSAARTGSAGRSGNSEINQELAHEADLERYRQRREQEQGQRR